MTLRDKWGRQFDEFDAERMHFGAAQLAGSGVSYTVCTVGGAPILGFIAAQSTDDVYCLYTTQFMDDQEDGYKVFAQHSWQFVDALR